MLFCFAVSIFLKDSSEWSSMLGICSFTLKLLKVCFFFFGSQNIYTRYTKNLGGKWLETPPWNYCHSNIPEDTKQGPRTIAQFYWLLIVAKSFSLLQKCRTSLPNTKSLQVLQPPGDASLLKGTKAVKLNICPVRTNEKKKGWLRSLRPNLSGSHSFLSHHRISPKHSVTDYSSYRIYLDCVCLSLSGQPC